MIPKLSYNLCLLLAFLFVIDTSPLQAQQQKIGYVNTDTILNQIPEYEGIQQQLQVLSQQWRAELGEMQQEIDRLEEDFKDKEILYTDDVRQQKQQEIAQNRQAREQYLQQKFGPEGEYYQKQQELLQPIQQNIYQAIAAVAQRTDFDFIFDRAQSTALLYSRKQWNLNEDVLQELGVSLNNQRN